MIKLIIFISLIINILLILIIKKKTLKGLINKKKVQSADLEKLSDIFINSKIDENLYGPKEDVIVKNFCIPSNNKIVGMTSNYEAWIISSLSKVSKTIFEFGTCSGKTTYLMALNSPENAKIISLTLKPENLSNIEKNNLDNKISFRNIIKESIYKNFLFTGSKLENKIEVIFQNSLDFDETQYNNFFDLIFIDGGHTYSVVKSDTKKAFKMINKNGIILWHDYVPGKTSAKDVVKLINEISQEKRIYNIQDTSLCYFKNEIQT